MDLEELKERYKLLPLWVRFLIAGAIGLLPGAYVYYDEGDALQSQLDEVAGLEATARDKFESSRQQKANLPKLEEELAFTEEQLIKAKKKLPDSYRIEDVLQKAATIAKEVGVKLIAFDPGDEIPHNDTYRYVEMPIKTELQGRFSQIAAFFDRIVHLENSIFVRKIEMAKYRIEATPEAGAGQPQKTEFQIARENRQNLRLKATFDLVIFRGMTEAEASMPAPGEEGQEEKPAKGKKAKDAEDGEEKPEEKDEKPVETAQASKPPQTAKTVPQSDDLTTF